MLKLSKKVIPFVVMAVLSVGTFAAELGGPLGGPLGDPTLLTFDQARGLLGGTPRTCASEDISEHCIHEVRSFVDIHHISVDVHRIAKSHNKLHGPRIHKHRIHRIRIHG